MQLQYLTTLNLQVYIHKYSHDIVTEMMQEWRVYQQSFKPLTIEAALLQDGMTDSLKPPSGCLDSVRHNRT